MTTSRVHSKSLLQASGVVLFLCANCLAQAANPVEDTGYVAIDRTHMAWPPPESVLNDLRSSNDETRLVALKLAGLTDQQAHEPIWSSGNDSPAKVIGKSVIKVSRTELMYAAFGEDASQQAIVAFEVPSLSSTYAAIAVQKGSRWERVAATNCWCKYDMYVGQDALAEFVSLRPAPGADPTQAMHFELVVKSSGGGTGIYTQYEAHFRIYRNELRQSLVFVSGFWTGDPTGPTPHWEQLERRWFTTQPVGGSALGGVLVEAKGKFPADKSPVIQWTVRPLLNMHLLQLTCRAYRWDKNSFRYERSSEPISACQVPSK